MRRGFPYQIFIPNRSSHTYDLDEKYVTKDCDRCPFYRMITRFNIEYKYCGGGKHFQLLFEREKKRKCEIISKDPPSGERSVEYIDKKCAELGWKTNKAPNLIVLEESV